MSQLVMEMLKQAAGEWGQRPVVVAASRRFDVERVLMPLASEITSWGSTNYEAMLGSDLAGGEVSARLTAEVRIALPWLADKLVSHEDWVAAAIISDILVKAVRDERVKKGLIEQWDTLLANAKEYRQDIGVILKAYSHVDQPDFGPETAAVYVPQPTLGAADRAFVCKDIHPLFTPDEFAERALRQVLRQRVFFAVTYRQRKELDHLLVARIITDGGSEQYVYSSHGERRPFMESSPVFGGPSLALADQVLVGDLTIQELPPKALSSVSVMARNRRIFITERFQAWALMCDGKIVGAWATKLRTDFSGVKVYHMVTAHSEAHDGLIELVIAAAVSKDAQLMYERAYLRKLRTAYVTEIGQPMTLGTATLFEYYGGWIARNTQVTK